MAHGWQQQEEAAYWPQVLTSGPEASAQHHGQALQSYSQPIPFRSALHTGPAGETLLLRTQQSHNTRLHAENRFQEKPNCPWRRDDKPEHKSAPQSRLVDQEDETSSVFSPQGGGHAQSCIPQTPPSTRAAHTTGSPVGTTSSWFRNPVVTAAKHGGAAGLVGSVRVPHFQLSTQ